MSAAIGARACRPAAATPLQPQRHRCRRHQRRLSVNANLLDLLRGGGSVSHPLETDPLGEELKAWAQERGLQAPQLAAAAIPGAGRGLVATSAIGKGEVLLHLPQPLLITPEAVLQRSALRGLLEDRPEPLPSWSVLALWLAEARAAGEHDIWWPYLRLLPARTGCVLEWSEEELGWLAGSQLAEAAAEIRGAADASWAEMQPMLAAAAALGLGPPGAFTRESLQWALSMLLSRLVRLPSLGASAEALLPFADLLNHDPTCTAFFDWSAAEEAVVLRADRKYRQGEEAHACYGHKTSGELLLSYGFCPAPGSNPHDGCQLRLGLRPEAEDPVHAWKAEALGRRGFAPSQLFPLRMVAAPWELMHYAALSVSEPASEAEAEVLARRLFDEDDMPPALQQAALERVVRACQAAQKAYPSSMDADRAELDALQEAAGAAQPAAAGGDSSGGNGSGQEGREGERERRRRQVLQCTVYERQVLARTVFVLQQELKDLKRMSGKA